ncbi:coniferyl aldehyde dehydrogenase [Celerinatantimonas diazotrophica]|uniref:Aldehyde dehydrogenase n=1 Tax=Celerinatantimonas diazotrophica TaxID=412034 RepID=A0A4R1K694_9GAMM|nr:coniferyl aldehyde dehydrogenase [Celerinatantimonas diazotrophica]TCK58579.1 coniferyl-aldehyde dehydrogenase [Celerinatantimonas diazotrophica]CAG9297208.1 Coniferyl aldehyde dehydrogenase [Celerinatantimonas diazotrophica]
MNDQQQPHTELLKTLTRLKDAHLKQGPANAQLRRDRLQRAIALLHDNREQLSEAISHDFGHRSTYQSLLADVASSINALNFASENLEQWMQPEVVTAPEQGMQTFIQQQPVGVVGIISPWNFPLNLAFGPLAGVFAAGNTAMLKPSELTPQTSALLQKLVAQYFKPDELTVVLGDADVGQAFSALPFDHLVFTGSSSIGKQVMRAASENLVPITLELGGKSPVVMAEDADIQQTAIRTMTVKTFNAGQICISPDYLMLPDTDSEAFVSAARQFMVKSFPSIVDNSDYTSIISQKHFDRLISLLEDAQAKGANIIALAPEHEAAFDAKTRKIAPHLVLNVTDEMKIMQEEIFGPLLPIKTYQQIDEAIDYINAHSRPLAAYYFGQNSDRQHEFAQRTTSGALVINDLMTHASIDTLPFGGVGASGIGAYHGIHGFRRFTHAKPVVIESEDGAANLRLRAPYQQKYAELSAFLDS